MLKVGITGGIGSGKTLICKIFELMGIPVYYADDRAKYLMVNRAEIVTSIKKLFGAEAYLPDGSLDRGFIAQQVFGNSGKLQQLNEIVHPAVWADGQQWHAKQLQKAHPYSLKEAALIFESGGDEHLDKVITVFAPPEVRINRVMIRDGITAQQVKERISKQWPDEKKVALADFVIFNDGSKFLIPQILKIHRALVNKVEEQQTPHQR